MTIENRIDPVQLRGTHRDSYRPYEWAIVTGVKMASLEGLAPRLVYEIKFPDGVVDRVAVSDTENYEIATLPQDSGTMIIESLQKIDFEKIPDEDGSTGDVKQYASPDVMRKSIAALRDETIRRRAVPTAELIFKMNSCLFDKYPTHD